MAYLGESHNGVSVEDADFKKLWLSNLLNIFGTSFSAGAVSVLAIKELNFPDSYIPLMLGVSSVIAALGAIPVGPFIESKRKRPILVNASIIRGLLLSALALLSWAESLDVLLIIFILTLASLLGITFGAASGVHTRDLVKEEDWHSANSKIESLAWIMPPIATPLGGVAIAYINPGFTLLINGIAYIFAGFIIKRISSLEPDPPREKYDMLKSKFHTMASGWQIIFEDRSLKHLFLNAMLFGGCLAALNPLIAIFILKDLGLNSRALAIILGIPPVAGFLGTRLSRKVAFYVGPTKLLLWGCAARSLWAPLIAFSPNGMYGLLFILLCECGLMFAAGLFNPLFSTYRMQVIDREKLARVGTIWPISASLVQPLFLFLSSFIVNVTDVRTSIGIIGALMVCCILLIPWKGTKKFIL